MTLHDELQRIADRAPVATVPDDTWSRGRRSLLRERVAAAGVAVAVVALVVGLAGWLPTGSEPPVADTGALGVPDALWEPPERMSDRENDGSWMRDEVTSDVTSVGTGAAAWVTYQGLPVVVGAADGAYHLLDLPDFVGNNRLVPVQGSTALSLSPDGRRLAYAYAVFGPDAATEPIPSGVRVLDLTTGAVREIPVPRKEGTAVHQLEWSPDGRWLAFSGTPQDTWTEMSMGSRGPAVLGRIAPGATTAQVREVGNDQAPLAIDDHGTVAWRTGRTHVWGPGRVRPAALDALGLLPDGRWLQRTGTANNDVLSVRGAGGAGVTGGARRILVQLYGVDGSVSIATDLMTPGLSGPGRLTVERPEPDWPMSDERRAATIALAVAVLLGGAILTLRVIRRFRSRES